VVVRYNSLLAVPNEISDQIAAQMLINTITASVLIKAGHKIALDRGVRPIRLVRSRESC
jgi:hypothetical protein